MDAILAVLASPLATLARVSRFASVVPLVATRALDRPFTYRGDGLAPGDVVTVRFGGARRRGVVIALEDDAPAGVDPAAVEAVVGSVPAPLVELAIWLAGYYGSTLARALALVAPVSRRRRGEPTRPELDELPPEAAPSDLTDAQREALARIEAALGSATTLLLYGQTGSGKTEVYLRACAAALARGLGAIVLVPEIALTPQALARFRGRFGDRVAVLHSGLTDAQRRDERERIASGDATVVVGARSAVFAPVQRLGVICVDEEQDPSYKQDSDPRYDARTVAAKRASLEAAVCVFGSATPRPESWYRLERLELGRRLARRLPPVRVVDLRREAGYPLSAPLLVELGRVAARRERAILLLNRRGVAAALHCRACGRTARCSQCDVALVLHADRRLHCHHCGLTEAAWARCPSCGSAEVARIGAGTERLEAELAGRLPELSVHRLDADTAVRGTDHGAILARFAADEGAVLLGTQMVAKGHHFAGITLAAVVDADAGLLMPDFRAEERTFQLITQLAGRSGRDRPGRVIVQTFTPDVRPVALAARHAVPEFLAGELERRRELGYPPFRHLVRILATGLDAQSPLALLRELHASLGDAGDELLGPAPLLRLRGRHRAQLLAKTDRPRGIATRAARLLAAGAPAMRRDGLTAVVDVDPQGW
jgi:primosomal protein N' (replication factor Y)